jgi:Mg-chelatase subunit ChlD
MSVDLVADVRLRYSLAHRYARVVIAIDASGSMGLAAPGGSLWKVAGTGATQAWSLLDGRDELGVWAFQGRSVRKLAPLGPRDDARVKATSAALEQIRPRGPAPLYSAVVGAVAAAGPSDDNKVTAVILMTDGEPDNASVLNEKQFRTAVQGKGVRVFAIAMGATGCAAPVLKTITTATAGKCLEADPGSAAGPMAAIFEAVL